MIAWRYRFNFTQVRVTSRPIQLSEVQFFQPNGQLLAFSRFGASNPLGNNPATQGADNVIDGSMWTKWLDFNMAVPPAAFGRQTNCWAHVGNGRVLNLR